jgi:hypothetical protein
MGLNDFFLPERLPRQVIYAGDRHAEIVNLQNKKIVGRTRVEDAPLDENAVDRWDDITARLQPTDAGIVFNASPFIFNFFEFDKLPWQNKKLLELVSWRLQKIFPENIETYEHRFFKLDKKRVLSILVRKSLLEKTENLFQEKRIPLIFIGNSTMELLARLQKAKSPPDFFIESDRDNSTVVFQNQRSPIYIRKFKSGTAADTVEEIGKTVTFVHSSYGITPRRYWLINHQDGPTAAAVETGLATADFSRCQVGLGKAPYIPDCL